MEDRTTTGIAYRSLDLMENGFQGVADGFEYLVDFGEEVADTLKHVAADVAATANDRVDSPVYHPGSDLQGLSPLDSAGLFAAGAWLAKTAVWIPEKAHHGAEFASFLCRLGKWSISR